MRILPQNFLDTLDDDDDCLLQVLDENDNSPVLDTSSLRVVVREDTEPGTVITAIQARDRDEGDFGTVTYAIDTKAGEDGGFRIDPGTGEVALTRSLDRERTPVHSLLVQAW